MGETSSPATEMESIRAAGAELEIRVARGFAEASAVATSLQQSVTQQSIQLEEVAGVLRTLAANAGQGAVSDGESHRSHTTSKKPPLSEFPTYTGSGSEDLASWAFSIKERAAYHQQSPAEVDLALRMGQDIPAKTVSFAEVTRFTAAADPQGVAPMQLGAMPSTSRGGGSPGQRREAPRGRSPSPDRNKGKSRGGAGQWRGGVTTCFLCKAEGHTVDKCPVMHKLAKVLSGNGGV